MHQLAGRREIADTMISIPHPFSEEQAREKIASYQIELEQGKAVHFAIQLKSSKQVIGAVELRAIDAAHKTAELSLWIGVEWWGQDFASEAAQVMVDYGFKHLGLNRIYGYHMIRNPASGRVMEKISMKKEGLLRQCVWKWDRFEDVVLMAVLREDWVASAHPGEGQQTE